jgi:hypothetical protein
MKTRLLALVTLGTVAGLQLRPCLADSPAAPAAPVRANYARPFEPPTRPAFLPLPPGAIEPAGFPPCQLVQSVSHRITALPAA